MPRKKIIGDENEQSNAWREGDLVHTFKLTRVVTTQTPLMLEWLDNPPLVLNQMEQYIFDRVLSKAQNSIAGWSEEDLKMKFIAIILDLGNMSDDNGVIGYFDKTISATVEGVKLTVKSDFMLAEGVLDAFRTPYFHFQEYKPNKNPSGDSMAQLLEAFLIAQVKNNNSKPLYGVEIIGANWRFVTMEGKTYCISKAFVATDRDDLLEIVAILRKFRTILFEKLIG